MLTMPGFRFLRPGRLEDALDALDGGSTLLVAGGTDVVPNMKRGLLRPERLVSLRRLPELAVTRVEADGSLTLGAGAVLADLGTDVRIDHGWPGIAAAARAVASPQIRNVATLGGNLCLDTRCAYYDQSAFWRSALGHCLKTSGDVCHVVPHGRRCVAALSADMPPALIAAGASIRLASRRGERALPLQAFYTQDGARNTVRTEDEIVVGVSVPAPEPGTRSAYVKVRPRGAIDFPALSVAVHLVLADGGVRSLRLVVGALASAPRVVDGLDALAVGRPLTPAVIDAVAERARAACHPLPNVDVDADWRRAVLPVHVRRVLAALAGRGQP